MSDKMIWQRSSRFPDRAQLPRVIGHKYTVTWTRWWRVTGSTMFCTRHNAICMHLDSQRRHRQAGKYPYHRIIGSTSIQFVSFVYSFVVSCVRSRCTLPAYILTTSLYILFFLHFISVFTLAQAEWLYRWYALLARCIHSHVHAQVDSST